jgi:hypothetical protein
MRTMLLLVERDVYIICIIINVYIYISLDKHSDGGFVDVSRSYIHIYTYMITINIQHEMAVLLHTFTF